MLNCRVSAQEVKSIDRSGSTGTRRAPKRAIGAVREDRGNREDRNAARPAHDGDVTIRLLVSATALVAAPLVIRSTTKQLIKKQFRYVQQNGNTSEGLRGSSSVTSC